MTRRLYTVMNNSQKALVMWLAALLTFSVVEWSKISTDFFNTYFFVVV